MILVLPSGHEVLYDEEDADLVRQYQWRVLPDEKRNYVCARRYANGELVRENILMHRLFMGNPPTNCLIDHRDLNGLNNRRDNLRFASPSQNAQNRARTQCRDSKFKGVTRGSKKNKWRAQISFQYRKYNLGNFPTELAAAVAYDAGALKYFGPDARLNFPHNL